MAKYRSVHVKIWRDPDFQQYNPAGKLVFLYLFTNPDVGESGLYTITPKTIRGDTGIRPAQIDTLLAGGLKNVHYDEATSTVFVAKFLLYNRAGRADLKRAAIENERLFTPSPLWDLFDKIYSFSEDDKILVNDSAMVSEPLNINNPINKPKPININKPKIKKEEIGVEALAVIKRAVVELEKLSSWPSDEGFRDNETVVLAELINEYPKIDAVAEARKLRTWLSERHPPKNPNYLLRLRNWFNKAEEFRVEKAGGKTSGKSYGGAGTEL